MNQAIIFLSIIISLTSFRNAENSPKTYCTQQQDIFTGNWKYKNGNEVFIIKLWKTSDGYYGHYKKIIVDANNTEVSEIFNSDKPVGASNFNWPYVLYGGTYTAPNYTIGGPISDNTVLNAPNGGFISEGFKMKIINPECYTTPLINCNLQAKFTVKKTPGLSNPAEPDFSIPTDIILTKE